MPEWTTSGFLPFLNQTWSRSTATRGLVLSPSWPDSPQDPVLQPDVRQVLWGGRQGASPGAVARRSLTGGDRTCASRARSEHPVHIPAPTGMRTGIKPKAAFLWPAREQGPGPARPRPRPVRRTRDPRPRGRPLAARAAGGDTGALAFQSRPPARPPPILPRSLRPPAPRLTFGSKNPLLPLPREASSFRTLIRTPEGLLLLVSQ